MLLNLLYAYSLEMVDFNILFQFYDCFWREICHASHAVIPEIPWFLFWYNFSDKLHKEQLFRKVPSNKENKICAHLTKIQDKDKGTE